MTVYNDLRAMCERLHAEGDDTFALAIKEVCDRFEGACPRKPEEVPPNNVTPKPRICENCRWWNTETNTRAFGNCHFEIVGVPKNADDFCSHWTAKEGTP